MRIGPKYKISRRLKAPIFEKTQTQKFALSLEKKSQKRGGRPASDFGIQLIEKQKVRYFYGLAEKQFKNYVKKALAKKGSTTAMLDSMLESRLDNVVWRAGLAPTHAAARQMVVHGHICINGKKVYSPSYEMSPDVVIFVREGSKKSPLFNKEKDENMQKVLPAWLVFDESKKEIRVKSKPARGDSDKDSLLDLGKVIEFYQR